MRKVFTVLIVLLPLLCQFGLPVSIPFVTDNLSIGHLLLLPFMAFWFLTKIPVEGIFRVKLYRFSGFFLFSVLSLLATVLAVKYPFASLRSADNAILMLLFWCVLLYAAKGVFNVAYGMRAYSWIAAALSAYLILQYIVFRVNGTILPDGFRESYVFGGHYVDYFLETHTPASLFLSADSYALYCVPALAFLLLWDRIGYRGRPFALSLIISGGIVLSSSRIGIVLTAFVWLVYIAIALIYFVAHPVDAVYRVLRQGAGRLCIQIFFFMAVIVLTTVMILNGTVSARVTPFVKTVMTDRHISAGFGFSSEMLQSDGMRLFGCGIGNIGAMLAHTGVSAIGLTENLNTLGVALLSTGMVGFLALVGMLFILIGKQKGKFGFAIAVSLLILSVFLDVSYSTVFGFYFLVASSANDAEMTTRDFLRIH